MADLSGVTKNFFTTASETFADNLSSSISAGAAIVPVNNASEYTNGDTVVLTVDPGTSNEATFIGVKNGSQFEQCVWTEGNTAVGHSAGATIIDYDSATHHSAQSKGILQFADQNGDLLTQAVRDALNLGTSSVNGWEVLAYTLQVTSGYNQGNKSYELTCSNNDLSSVLSPGMRLRLQRGTTAPTQCMDLESSSSQYASKTTPSGVTFTDDWTEEAWINIESYANATAMMILSRATSTFSNGFQFYINGTGQLVIAGAVSAGNFKTATSYQAIPLAKWYHVAATMDLSGTASTMYINGISVPNAISTSGACTALTQSGDLIIGNQTSQTYYFDGKISDVRLWNVIRTQTQIRDNMHQQLVGTETNLIGYWKLNGNLNDSTTNANNLTGSGGAVATTVDNPMKDTEYAIITKVAYSAPNTTITVFTGTDYCVPNMTLNSPYYSTQKTPYGFPSGKDKWSVITYIANRIAGSSSLDTWGGGGSAALNIPVGAWDTEYNIPYYSDFAGATWNRLHYLTLSTSSSTESDSYWTSTADSNSPSNSAFGTPMIKTGHLSLSSATPYYIVFKDSGGGGLSNNTICAAASSVNATGYIKAVSSYL